MLDAISRFFQNRLEPVTDADSPGDRLAVATCALLLEVAHADETFTEAEHGLIERLMRSHFGLGEDDAAELVRLAESERRDATDLYQFARLINERYSRADKILVMQQLWRVVYSDGRLEAHEDALMHKLAHLLQLRHDELIAVKLEVKRRLEQQQDERRSGEDDAGV
ncbi:MAG: TerB family tellurite resistance protein [Candidatus Krumholzibacteriia bacterium]